MVPRAPISRRSFLKTASVGSASLFLPALARPDTISRKHHKPGDVALVRKGVVKGGVRRYFDVGTFYVGEIPEDPDSELVKLPLVRMRSLYPNYNSPLFLLGDRHGFSGDYFDSRDVVSVGSRGVEGTVYLDCPEIEEALVVEEGPLSPESLAALTEATGAAFQRLREEGRDVGHYTLVDVVEDLEVAREALGYQRVALWGHGHGAQIAHIYSARYPVRHRLASGQARVRAEGRLADCTDPARAVGEADGCRNRRLQRQHRFLHARGDD